MGGIAVDLARRGRRGIARDRVARRDGPFRRAVGRGLCPAAPGRRTDCPRAYRTEISKMTAAARMHRIEPQPWMVERATRKVLRPLFSGGAEARFVGGSVRDALLGRPIDDIDIATTVPPGRVMELLSKAGVKVVTTGLAHGTVTAIVGRPP